MKAFTILVAFSLFIFASCKKSSSSPSNNGTNTISATIDGVTQTFNTIVIAKNTTAANSGYTLYFAGVNGTTATSDELSITVDAYHPITTGTFTLADISPTSSYPAIGYDKGYYQQSTSNYYLSDFTGSYPTIVTITALSSTNVQGTFSGTLVLNAGTSSAQTKAITNGKFNVNFK